MKKNKMKGFTLVELLAVIVILAIILVIAVPKVMSIIEDAKMGTLESTAKMIASAAEKQKVQNTVLGNDKEITCDSVAKINKGDYASCDITFENNTAKVTIEGSGKFDGLWVCNGTKTSSEAIKQECTIGIKELEIVQNKLFNLNEEITTNELEVIAKFEDGTTRKLNNGTETYLGEEEAVEVTSPNYPENYPNNMTEEENYWEYTFDGAVQVKVKVEFFDLASFHGPEDCVKLYDKTGVKQELWGGYAGAGDVVLDGNYVKITMLTDSNYTGKGFSAIVIPIYNTEPEYNIIVNEKNESEKTIDTGISVNLNVIPNNGKEVIKNVSLLAGPRMANEYIEYLNTNEQKLKNGLITDDTTDKNIRYAGEKNDVKNKVYFNCKDTDSNNLSYGNANYDYKNSCEVWNIIGLLNTQTIENGDFEKRIKIYNTNYYITHNYGCDGNWSNISIKNYLNNDFYNSLSLNSKEQIQDVIWNLGVIPNIETLNALSSYEYERGNITPSNIEEWEFTWLGKIGLVYPSDIAYSSLECTNMFSSCKKTWMKKNYEHIWTITRKSDQMYAYYYDSQYTYIKSGAIGYDSQYIKPTLYLNSNIKIVSGNGDTEPYVLAM